MAAGVIPREILAGHPASAATKARRNPDE